LFVILSAGGASPPGSKDPSSFPRPSPGVIPTGAKRSGGTCFLFRSAEISTAAEFLCVILSAVFLFVILSGGGASPPEPKDPSSFPRPSPGVIPTGAKRSGGTCFSLARRRNLHRSRISLCHPERRRRFAAGAEGPLCLTSIFLVSSRPERSAVEGPAFLLHVAEISTTPEFLCVILSAGGASPPEPADPYSLSTGGRIPQG
jgi:hypothetical protein